MLSLIAEVLNNVPSIGTPMLRMSIDVLPAIISPIINSNFFSKVLGLLKTSHYHFFF